MSINNWVQSFAASKFMVLLLVNFMLLVAGMFIEPNSSLVVLTPLFYPIATTSASTPFTSG